MRPPSERIKLFVPTRGHVWHATAATLSYVGLKDEIGLPQYVRGVTGPADVRNEIVSLFLKTDADVLVMVDDDVVPPPSFMRLAEWIEAGEADVVGAPVPIMRPGTTFLPNVFERSGDSYAPAFSAYQKSGLVEVDAIGTGCIAIARKVLLDNHLKQPFRPRLNKDGTWQMGEDITFCQRAKARGFRVFADLDLWCEHLSELHANSVAMAYMQLVMDLDDEEEETEADELRTG